MRTLSYKILMTLTVLSPTGQLAAQEILSLVCVGEIELTTDISKKERTRETIDISIDLRNSVMDIKGNWGCFSDMGSSFNEKPKCIGKQAVDISESKISYVAKGDGGSYSSQTSLIIDRYSGALSVSGMVFANPPARANWGMLWSSGRLQCTAQTKKF
jgi:hypothetical protein